MSYTKGPLKGLVKVAVRREEGYPEGIPAPCFLICTCREKLPISNYDDEEVITCPKCGTQFDEGGWILQAKGGS